MTKPQGLWRKSWSFQNIYGTSRFEFSQPVRGVWNDLLDLAKLSRVPDGVIAPGLKQSYPHAYLASLLNTPLDEFERALEVLKATGRISENHNGIKIIKWKEYQFTEYDRQKPYRQKSIDPDKFKKGKYGHMVQS